MSFLRLSLKLSNATDWYLQKVAAACWNASPLGPSNCCYIGRQVKINRYSFCPACFFFGRLAGSEQGMKQFLTIATRISPTVSTAGWSRFRALIRALKRPWISNMSGKLGKSRLTKSLKPLSSSGR